MKEKWNYVIYLLWFSYLVLSAVLMFGHGFLLSRKTLSDVSECVSLKNFGCDGRVNLESTETCTEDEKIRRILSNPAAELVCTSTRFRVVFMLVDALRYDFTEYDPGLQDPLPYQNCLPVISETLEKFPKHSRLFRFMADPPTTTLQRVKALVTGSLPTFIDASSNFAATELREDNTIDQVAMDGGKIVLLGDDTWARLIPGKYTRSHVMYSFHTWDLDTVDSEVDTKIYDELQKDDWNLLIAHYLGVDHAGHRYGPNHREMTRKLNETNIRLKKMIEILPPDVLLIVVGDHGMTETGDHGGESRAERTAALFAYRGSGLSSNDYGFSNGKEVQQTELAPTISAALGRPPPAPSLGSVLFPVLPTLTIPQTLLHMSNGMKQVMKYLVRYGEESQQIPLDRLAQFINATREQLDKINKVNTEAELVKYFDEVRVLIDNIRGGFREVWVEFDSLSMLRALLLLILVIFFNCLVTEGLPTDRIPSIFASSFVPTGVIANAVCISLCYTIFYFELLEDLEHAIILSTGLISGAMLCTLVIMHWDGITQRWYENKNVFYERFARAVLFGSAAILSSNSFIIEEGASLSYLSLSILAAFVWNVKTLEAVTLWALSGIILAVSRSYRGCREEQGACWTEGKGVPSGQPSRLALILALGSIAAVLAITRRHIGWRGHGLVLAGLFSCAHWALGWRSLGSPSRSRFLARCAWLVLAVMFLLLWKRERGGATLALIICSLLIYVANCLVLGASYAPSAAIGLLSGFLALNVVSMMKSEGSNKFSISTRTSASVACMWALLASYHFYGTGHHATLGHLRWAPAFHAGDPNYLSISPLIIGFLVSLELFGMPLLFGAAVPLLALWPRSGAAAVGPRTQLAAVFTLCLKFGLCFAVRVFASALAATVHCRHLMIWGVFTPKLLFESGACAAALLGMVIGATLTTWHLPTNQRQS
ncbi:GPI ethanolamine phosphate transferase 3 isoform X2 [Plodia interpunctella]|uniref:GPI ethanolamine phosphate transferase 3 isoform X2 n=1 Tax=Plodia interpunctella TaxID=58824 RepID=UPI002367B111|nr:GPI ethanolamine phosphate transferase 3 isoform X2 [Plodia interpunctella]